MVKRKYNCARSKARAEARQFMSVCELDADDVNIVDEDRARKRRSRRRRTVEW